MIPILIRIILTPFALLADSLIILCWFILTITLGQERFQSVLSLDNKGKERQITKQLWYRPWFKNKE